MKILFFAFALILSTQSFANLEHQTGIELGPTKEHMAINHACFEELERVGCGHPQEDREHFKQCATDQLERLQRKCQMLIKKLYHL